MTVQQGLRRLQPTERAVASHLCARVGAASDDE